MTHQPHTPAPRTAAHARTTPPAGGMAGGDIPADGEESAHG